MSELQESITHNAKYKTILRISVRSSNDPHKFVRHFEVSSLQTEFWKIQNIYGFMMAYGDDTV